MRRFIKTLFLFIGIILMVTACFKEDKKVSGSGEIVSKTLSLSPFNSIELNVPSNLLIKKSETYTAVISSRSNIQSVITMKVNKEGVLKIYYNKTVTTTDNNSIEISMPSINVLTLKSSGNISFADSFKTSELQIIHDGTGYIILKGSGYYLSAQLKGNGIIDASQYKTTVADVSLTGTGYVYINSDYVENSTSTGIGEIINLAD